MTRSVEWRIPAEARPADAHTADLAALEHRVAELERPADEAEVRRIVSTHGLGPEPSASPPTAPAALVGDGSEVERLVALARRREVPRGGSVLADAVAALSPVPGPPVASPARSAADGAEIARLARPVAAGPTRPSGAAVRPGGRRGAQPRDARGRFAPAASGLSPEDAAEVARFAQLVSGGFPDA